MSICLASANDSLLSPQLSDGAGLSMMPAESIGDVLVLRDLEPGYVGCEPEDGLRLT